MLLNSKLALQESSGRERAAPSRFLFLVVVGWLLVCIIRIPFLVCLALWSRSRNGVRVPSREGRRGEEGGALGRARREGLQDAGPMRGLPEGAKRVRICRSIRRLARHDAGQGIHPARSNPPPVQGHESLRLRRVKPENDWRTDNGFPTTAQRQASSTLCLSSLRMRGGADSRCGRGGA